MLPEKFTHKYLKDITNKEISDINYDIMGEKYHEYNYIIGDQSMLLFKYFPKFKEVADVYVRDNNDHEMGYDSDYDINILNQTLKNFNVVEENFDHEKVNYR